MKEPIVYRTENVPDNYPHPLIYPKPPTPPRPRPHTTNIGHPRDRGKIVFERVLFVLIALLFLGAIIYIIVA